MRSPEHPCPNHNDVCVTRAYGHTTGHQSIHAQTIITFVFQGHTVTRAPSNHNNVRVCKAYGHQSFHAQTIITFYSKSRRSPERACPNHNNAHVPIADGQQSIHAHRSLRSPFLRQLPHEMDLTLDLHRLPGGATTGGASCLRF